MRTTSTRTNATYNRIVNSNPTPKFKPVALDTPKFKRVAEQAARGIARILKVETDTEKVERKMCEAAEEIEAEKEVKRQDPEYVKYVKQFSPEVVETLIGSEEEDTLELTFEEEAPIVVAREKTYERMMEASDELIETAEDINFNEDEIEAARDEYKSFVELYGGNRLLETYSYITKT